MSKMMRTRELKSVICNTVHDSIVLDVHPDEKDACIKLLEYAMLSLPTESSKPIRQLNMICLLEIELKIGKNWLDTEVVNL